jgi:hypothetical protein
LNTPRGLLEGENGLLEAIEPLRALVGRAAHDPEVEGEAMNVRDVRVIERRQRLGLASKAREALGVAGKAFR